MKLIKTIRQWFTSIGKGSDEEWKLLYKEAFDQLHPDGAFYADKELTSEEKDVAFRRWQSWKAGLPR